MNNKANAAKMKPRQLTPNLRFPEFQNAPEWESKLLGHVVKNVTTGKLDANAMVENGAYRFYTCAKNYYRIDNYAFDGEALLIAGNGAYLGYIHHYKGKFNAYQRTYVLQDFDANVMFLKYYLDRHLPARISVEKKEGNTPYIVMATITEAPIAIPIDIAEQQKIADCLTSLDDLIAAHNQKLTTLKSHKKGLMQALFPAPGATLPQLRFPEFQHAPEWGRKTLDGIASFYKGKGISKADINLQGETPCIRYGELYTIYGEIIKTVFSKTKLSASDLFLSQENDVIIPSSGETKIDIARASCVLLNNVALGGDLNILRSDENGVFLSYLLNGPYKREIAKKAQGDAVAHLYASQLKLLEIMIPKVAEQQKIADCLSSLDEQIAAQGQKLEALKVHKKGLMQGLFPSVEEGQA